MEQTRPACYDDSILSSIRFRLFRSLCGLAPESGTEILPSVQVPAALDTATSLHHANLNVGLLLTCPSYMYHLRRHSCHILCRATSYSSLGPLATLLDEMPVNTDGPGFSARKTFEAESALSINQAR